MGSCHDLYVLVHGAEPGQKLKVDLTLISEPLGCDWQETITTQNMCVFVLTAAFQPGHS